MIKGWESRTYKLGEKQGNERGPSYFQLVAEGNDHIIKEKERYEVRQIRI